MVFPTVTFAVFFLIVYAVHWRLQGHPGAWKWFMLAASYVFYGWWDWRFLALIGGSSIINHALAVMIAGSESPRTRKGVLAVSVVLNLGLLGFFKYFHFFVDSAYALCDRLGLACNLPLLDVILPVGISFFTFQAMSYVIDVYRRELEPARSTLDFALYLAFFPQLVAGPIVRAKVLLPQIESPPVVTRVDLGRATVLILVGLFKKTVVANYLATVMVDPVFAVPQQYGALDTLFAVYGYAVQIYCDFSAYSDLAIGTALLLGFHFPVNFDAPYMATSMREFWRRWHISLSTWLRDYLFHPLGGSRRPGWRLHANLFITFLLGGLWHGAGWNFVLWGALNGLYLSAEHWFSGFRAHRRAVPSRALQGALGRVMGRVLVFNLVAFAIIFFRSSTLADAWTLLQSFGSWRMPHLVTWPVVAAIFAGLSTQAFDGDRAVRLWDRYARWPAWAQAACAAAIMLVICGLGPHGVAPFIYFQF